MFKSSFYDSFVSFYDNFGIRLKVVTSSSGKFDYDHFDTDTTYIDKTVWNDIQKQLHTCTRDEVVFDTKVHVNLTIVGQNIKEIRSYKTQIIVVLGVFLDFISKTFDVKLQNLNLLIFLSSHKKMLPQKPGPLTPRNVNTGVTLIYPNNDFATIVVYRKEELLKVLIHELIHYTGIDEVDLPFHEKELKGIFKSNSPLFLRETYTDFIACSLHTMLYSLLDSEGLLHKKPDYLQEYTKNMNVEREHIMKQALKVTQYNKLCTRHGNIHEYTHVTAYYILKAIMFDSWKKFISMIEKKHDKREIFDKIVAGAASYLHDMCSQDKIQGDTTLRMTSLDAHMKMKTI